MFNVRHLKKSGVDVCVTSTREDYVYEYDVPAPACRAVSVAKAGTLSTDYRLLITEYRLPSPDHRVPISPPFAIRH